MPVPGIAADLPGGALRLVDGWLRTLLPAPAKYQGMSSTVLWIRIRIRTLSDRQHLPAPDRHPRLAEPDPGLYRIVCTWSVFQPNVKINYTVSRKFQYAVQNA
jgi:hypothetical protein